MISALTGIQIGPRRLGLPSVWARRGRATALLSSGMRVSWQPHVSAAESIGLAGRLTSPSGGATVAREQEEGERLARECWAKAWSVESERAPV